MSWSYSSLPLSTEQREIFEKYSFRNYAGNLTGNEGPLCRDEILRVEKATRGQSDNPLWNMLRNDRNTASTGSHSFLECKTFHHTDGMIYGLVYEKIVKFCNNELIRLLKDFVCKTSKKQVIHTVLDSGLFLSVHGLHAASPDAYFMLDDGTFVPLEIKCPLTYKDVTIEQMRAGFKRRKQRYRVACTAFSVNHSGTPVFSVESKDPHYRQMQRQMYVMNSPFALYLVKFKYGFVIMPVWRDKSFCEQELSTEKAMYAKFAKVNAKSEWYNNQKCRMETFAKITSPLGDAVVEKLSRQGFYYRFGELICAFCNKRFDVNCNPDLVTIEHGSCANSGDNLNLMRTVHKDFLKFDIRQETLPRGTDPKLIKDGLFIDPADGVSKLFCCGRKIVDFTNIVHQKDCDYQNLLNQSSYASKPIVIHRL
ncbi:alkaline exonuclease [Alphabaculovirus altermyunipunctae]|uniref:Alkaline exonuclease n=1 Tax=Mythimna unipuncta nucleopolyhedrovirus TaxID=447897 RepID=A0A346TPR2_9ABAC|nr:alkaline exonuclease [Mythimna unipuncta nucleopolyhedrovirus]AXU41572.1 alkaline exonuclease [Mythimna unipuncta nucleopolyhedrovirus]